MAETPVIKAELREEFGKGAARRLRREWRLPGVLYGNKAENIHFHADLLEMQALIRNDGTNAVLELEIDGEQHLAMVKHIDQNVLTLDIDHIDLLNIKRGEKVEVEVPVLAVGEIAPAAQLLYEVDNIVVLVDALKIPEEIEINVEGLEAGTMVNAGDITLPEGVELIDDPETLVLNITHEEVAEVPEEGEEGGADATEVPATAGSDDEGDDE